MSLLRSLCRPVARALPSVVAKPSLQPVARMHMMMKPAPSPSAIAPPSPAVVEAFQAALEAMNRNARRPKRVSLFDLEIWYELAWASANFRDCAPRQTTGSDLAHTCGAGKRRRTSSRGTTTTDQIFFSFLRIVNAIEEGFCGVFVLFC